MSVGYCDAPNLNVRYAYPIPMLHHFTSTNAVIVGRISYMVERINGMDNTEIKLDTSLPLSEAKS